MSLSLGIEHQSIWVPSVWNRLIALSGQGKSDVLLALDTTPHGGSTRLCRMKTACSHVAGWIPFTRSKVFCGLFLYTRMTGWEMGACLVFSVIAAERSATMVYFFTSVAIYYQNCFLKRSIQTSFNSKIFRWKPSTSKLIPSRYFGKLMQCTHNSRLAYSSTPPLSIPPRG